jgi:hypothetical protein
MNGKELTRELEIVAGGDLLGVAILLSGTTQLTREHLEQTAKHKDSSVLSLLLSHPSSKGISEINKVFLYLVHHANMNLIKVILQFEKITFPSRKIDRIIEECFLTNNTQLLSLILGDKRFKPIETLPYVLYACKCQPAVDILNTLFRDTRFLVPIDKICKVLCHAVLDMNVVSYLIDVLPRGYVTSQCVVKAIRSGNAASFLLLLRQLDSNGYPSIVAECFFPDPESNGIEMFKLLLANLPDHWIPKIYKLCFVNEDSQRLKLVLDSDKLARNTNLLCLGLFDVNQDFEMLNSLIGTLPLCDLTGCFITSLLKGRYDRIALNILDIHKNSIFCKHVDEFLTLAVENMCMKTVSYLLDKTVCNVTSRLQDKILATKDETCITKMLQHGTLDHELVYKRLENKDLYVVDIIARHYSLELFWNSYQLLRLAAQDKTSNSYDALYGRLNPYKVD